MKFILKTILVILGLCVGIIFLPAILGIFFGTMQFDDGNILGGVIRIAIGLVVQVLVMLYIFSGSGGGGGSHYHDEECPYCGSGDTDGNHCFTCDDDF